MGGITHNDGDIGCRQYRRIINAVTDHHDHGALLLQCLNPLQLVCWCHSGIHVLNASLATELLCRGLVVTTH